MSDVALPDVEYLSATLELVESGAGEVRKLAIVPFFDAPRMEISIVGGDDEEAIALNRRQIECLSDFLTAWLGRAK